MYSTMLHALCYFISSISKIGAISCIFGLIFSFLIPSSINFWKRKEKTKAWLVFSLMGFFIYSFFATGKIFSPLHGLMNFFEPDMKPFFLFVGFFPVLVMGCVFGLVFVEAIPKLIESLASKEKIKSFTYLSLIWFFIYTSFVGF